MIELSKFAIGLIGRGVTVFGTGSICILVWSLAFEGGRTRARLLQMIIADAVALATGVLVVWFSAHTLLQLPYDIWVGVIFLFLSSASWSVGRLSVAYTHLSIHKATEKEDKDQSNSNDPE